LLTVAVANDGPLPLRRVVLRVALGDAAGQPMKTALVTLEGALAPGQAREQVWALPVDPARPAERHAADLPLSALSVEVLPVEVR